MYLLSDKKGGNVVMTLELHRSYIIHCIYFIYSSKDRPLSVCSLLVLKLLHRYNHGKVTC